MRQEEAQRLAGRAGRTPGPVLARAVAALLVALLALAACSREPPDLDAPEPPWILPADYPQAFRVEGSRIVDGRGAVRVLRGVALPDPVWLAIRDDAALGRFDRALFREVAEWRADIVRLTIFPASFRRHGEAETLRVLDWAVAYARRYGLYLIIGLHGIGFPPDGRHVSLRDPTYGELYQVSDAEARRFWRLLARRYRGEPAVAFYELFNEPVRLDAAGRPAAGDSMADWLRWRDWAEALVDLVRENDPAKPVIVGGLQFAYDLSFARQAPLRRANIVYATHPYADADWQTSWAEAFLEPARHLAVFATEFGWDERRHPENAYRGEGRYREAILAAFDRAGIGWTAWSFSHSFPPALLRGPDRQQTEYGEVVRQALAARAGGRPWLPGLAPWDGEWPLPAAPRAVPALAPGLIPLPTRAVPPALPVLPLPPAPAPALPLPPRPASSPTSLIAPPPLAR